MAKNMKPPLAVQDFNGFISLADADGVQIGDVYDRHDADQIVAMVNMHGDLVGALESLLDMPSGCVRADIDTYSNRRSVARAVLARAKG